jgi:hypothetical protein
MSVTPDEITPIAKYMADEMNKNLAGADGQKMLGLNSFSSTTCIQNYQKLPLWRQLLGLGITPQQCVDMDLQSHIAALIIWADLVKQDGDWDHKPKIARMFHPRVPGGNQNWHLYGSTLYFYDVWSNIHYGYVGKGVGFSDGILLDGAGLEQIGSTLLRFSLPQSDSSVSGLRKWDDPSDRAAIEMGIKMFHQYPNNVTTQIVLDGVVNSNAILKKPFVGTATGATTGPR